MTTLDNHGKKIVDDDVRLTIDPDSRTITSPNGKLVLVQYDHDSERITFECPRYVDGHDMLEVDFVEVLYTTAGGAHGLYVCDDLEQDGADAVSFSWLVSRNATKDVGTLSVIVRFMCLDTSGNVDYAWHTAMFKKITVSQGMDADAVMEEYPDALVQWREEVIDEAVERVGGSELAGKIDANTENIAVNAQAIAENTKAIEELSEGGGTAVQSDWEQSDPEAPDYVKNRPFYKENALVEEEILKEAFAVPDANVSTSISKLVTSAFSFYFSQEVTVSFSRSDDAELTIELALISRVDYSSVFHNDDYDVTIKAQSLDDMVHITVGKDIAQNYDTVTSIKSVQTETTYQVIPNDYLPSLEKMPGSSILNAKADKSDLDAKADKSDLDAKADKSDLDAKADKSDLIQADWDEDSTSSNAYIKSRPMYKTKVPSAQKDFVLITGVDGMLNSKYTFSSERCTVSPREWYASVRADLNNSDSSTSIPLEYKSIADKPHCKKWVGTKEGITVSITYDADIDEASLVMSGSYTRFSSLLIAGCTAEYEYTPLAPEYLPDLTDQTLTATDGTAYRVQALPSGSVYLIPETDPSEITDSWDEIIAALDDGTYKTKYSVHQTKRLDLGTEGMIEMEIVGIDVDDIAADGAATGEKAKLSMIAKTGLATSMRMNPPISGNATNGYAEGTGTIGGFLKSNMYRYLTGKIKPLFPANVKARLATVAKSYYEFDTTGTRSQIFAYGLELWLPSWYEMAQSGGLYNDAFSTDTSRAKGQFGRTGNKTYWTRDAGGKADSFIAASPYGSDFYPLADIEKSVVIGFCLN